MKTAGSASRKKMRTRRTVFFFVIIGTTDSVIFFIVVGLGHSVKFEDSVGRR